MISDANNTVKVMSEKQGKVREQTLAARKNTPETAVLNGSTDEDLARF